MSHFTKSMSGMFKLQGCKQGMEEQPSFLTYNICKDSAMRRPAKGFGNKRMGDPQAGRGHSDNRVSADAGMGSAQINRADDTWFTILSLTPD